MSKTNSKSGRALAALRVVDLGRRPAAARAAQLLAELGADVVRLERDAEPDDAQYRALNRHKRSVRITADPDNHAALEAWLRDADVVVDDGELEAAGFDPTKPLVCNRDLIVCSVTPYGLSGPRRGEDADEAVLQAQAGLMAITGHDDDAPGGGPMQIGVPLITGLSAVNAATGVIALLIGRLRAFATPTFVDVAMFDVAVTMQSHVVQNYLISGRQPQRRGNAGNGGHPAQTFDCADGVIYISAGTDQHYAKLCEALGHADMVGDPRFADVLARDRNRAEIDAVLGPIIKTRSRQALMDLLVKAGVPCSTVNTYADLAADPHVQARGLILRDEDGLPGVASPLRLPRSPTVRPAAPPPGEPFKGWLAPRRPRSLHGDGAVSAAPLDGVRVLDLGRVLAAPWAAQVLGDFGANVLKVERPGRGDDARLYGPDALIDAAGARTLESAFHLCANRNKRSILVDLASAEGQARIRTLAADADVLIENFIAGNLARFGLDASTLGIVNSQLIYVSLTGYGQSGPYADRPGYDAVFQAQGGLMAMTGLPDGEPGGGPLKTGPSLMDVSTGQFAALAAVAALYQRYADAAPGQHVDVALLDVAVAMQAGSIQSFLETGRQPSRRGNYVGSSPTGLYICQDGPIFLSVSSPDHLHALATLASTVTPSPSPSGSGKANGTGLEERLRDAFRRTTRDRALERLAALGVPGAAVNRYDEVFADAQLRARALVQDIAHPASGTNTVRILSSPIFLGSHRSPSERPPMLGEHEPATGF
ncbi:CaiB/BaiF CoA transferase family protein [Brevundimonas diminuta]|uniref:CaiB/BaiF CoA transferase family protein n=3 Tax=Brevundimonas diminuta TaxID=293 RepID=UPI0015586406|nr:CoA transferase [Brevundimonas diminuta]WQE44482.1 CoA transferase [Brevundimonas diminuta]